MAALLSVLRVAGRVPAVVEAWVASLAARLPARDDDRRLQWPGVIIFAVSICLATIALVVFGYIATREWQRSVALLVSHRNAEAVALASSALTRDMKGAWTSLIVPINELSIREDPPYNLLQPVARAFARFSYPETFLVWKAAAAGQGTLYAFNRTDRLPPWERRGASTDPFPVVLSVNPAGLEEVVPALRRQAAEQPFVYDEIAIDGVPYQIVAHLLFANQPPHALVGVAAFTVNLNWLRAEYFGPLLQQVSKIGGHEESFTFSVFDQEHAVVAGPGVASSQGLSRSFPLLFLDSALVSLPPQRSSGVSVWQVGVAPRNDTALVVAQRGAWRTFMLLAIAAMISMLALFMTLRAVRATAVLAAMKSDFVATVTHELKTPVACIRLIGDTLSQHRYTSTDTIRDYARLLSDEGSRLSRTIDQLLLYAKYSSTGAHPDSSLLPVNVRDLVDDALEQFRPTLERQEFSFTVDVADRLPLVKADRVAMVQIMENVIDNAIKYSERVRVLRITATAMTGRVEVVFEDHGMGIAPEDLPHVFERFYRGRNTQRSGSGLGLAIAARVMKSHNGDIRISSALAVGTKVVLTLVGVDKP